ncbi:hypothetical protein P154DRAFT_608170, partial [Amniculicola lignicola CBS 123094]
QYQHINPESGKYTCSSSSSFQFSLQSLNSSELSEHIHNHEHPNFEYINYNEHDSRFKHHQANRSTLSATIQADYYLRYALGERATEKEKGSGEMAGNDKKKPTGAKKDGKGASGTRGASGSASTTPTQSQQAVSKPTGPRSQIKHNPQEQEDDYHAGAFESEVGRPSIESMLAEPGTSETTPVPGLRRTDSTTAQSGSTESLMVTTPGTTSRSREKAAPPLQPMEAFNIPEATISRAQGFNDTPTRPTMKTVGTGKTVRIEEPTSKRAGKQPALPTRDRNAPTTTYFAERDYGRGNTKSGKSTMKIIPKEGDNVFGYTESQTSDPIIAPSDEAFRTGNRGQSQTKSRSPTKQNTPSMSPTKPQPTHRSPRPSRRGTKEQCEPSNAPDPVPVKYTVRPSEASSAYMGNTGQNVINQQYASEPQMTSTRQGFQQTPLQRPDNRPIPQGSRPMTAGRQEGAHELQDRGRPAPAQTHQHGSQGEREGCSCFGGCNW